MKFLDFDRNYILKNSKVVDGGYYEYTLGSPLEITTIKSANSNKLISKNLSSNVKDDKLMIKYSPTNKILFSSKFLHSDTEEVFASCFIDRDTNSVFIGLPNEFEGCNGVLAFSGYLSANNLVEEDRNVLCNMRFKNTIKERVRVLSIGVRGDKLYALWYIPSARGIAMSVRGSKDKGVSTTTYKTIQCKEYFNFTIKDWFDYAKVREL